MYKVLIFGGTTEGRILSKRLLNYNLDVTVSVATDAGRDALRDIKGVRCLVNRLDSNEMNKVLKSYDIVIDATHPFASEVTNNIALSCRELNLTYFRLIRDESEVDEGIYLKNIYEAVEYLKNTKENILLTTGSKDLHLFSSIENFSKRIFARVLPTVDIMKKCYDIGFTSENIIAVRGPFTLDMNTAIINLVNAKYIVTKESGDIGGFNEKVKAAKLTGSKLIVIGRPEKEKGYSINEIEKKVLDYFNIDYKIENQSYFPMFINLKDKDIKVFGGGKIATRRIKTLLNFSNNINVISPNISKEIQSLLDGEQIKVEFREYKKGDCNGADMVLGLTNSRDVNHEIYKECKKIGIHYNIGDKKEECNFYFPGVVKKEHLVIGVTASGSDHTLAKSTVEDIKDMLAFKGGTK